MKLQIIFMRKRADLDLFETLFLRTRPFLAVYVYISAYFGGYFSVQCMLYEVCLPFDAR